jgi:hemerythrin-like domain-containing protein
MLIHKEFSMQKDISGRDPSAPSFVSSLIHEIKNSLRREPHTLNEIKKSIEDASLGDLDFIALMEVHHDYLKESIVILMDKEAPVSEKQFHLDRFLKLVDMHGKAEQETLYQSMIQNRIKEARLEALSAQDEHDIAFELSQELRELRFELEWTEEIDAKAKVIATLVANHIKEEEGQVFPTARKDISSFDMDILCKEYIRRCQGYLEIAMTTPRATMNI